VCKIFLAHPGVEVHKNVSRGKTKFLVQNQELKVLRHSALAKATQIFGEISETEGRIRFISRQIPFPEWIP
jgi:hypothetical protein